MMNYSGPSANGCLGALPSDARDVTMVSHDSDLLSTGVTATLEWLERGSRSYPRFLGHNSVLLDRRPGVVHKHLLCHCCRAFSDFGACCLQLSTKCCSAKILGRLKPCWPLVVPLYSTVSQIAYLFLHFFLLADCYCRVRSWARAQHKLGLFNSTTLIC